MPATDKFRYNLKTMHVVFAVSCLAIFLATIAMMWKDHKDDWRGYQKTAFKLSSAKAALEKQQLMSGDYEATQKQLQAAVEAADAKIKDRQVELDNLLAKRKGEAFVANKLAIELKGKNAWRDKGRADRDLLVRDEITGQPLKAATAKFAEYKETRDKRELELQDAEAALAVTDARIKAITKDRDAARDALKKANADIERIDKTVLQIDPTGFQKLKRWTMELPIIDGFNSHMRIIQDWLPDLEVTLGMSKIARFDRCRTCHLNIDVTATGNVAAYPHGKPSSDDVQNWVKENKFPQPFSTHPNHELYASSSSPHPVAKFGCTICHDGQGSGTSFGNAEHTPDNPEQFERWHQEYGFHPNHFWELPMQPKRFIESGCIKCHHQVTELGVNPRFGASAPKVYRGYETMKKYGCFGCHEIHGFDGTTAIGPDLRLEPNFGSVASQMMSMLGGSTGPEADKARGLLAAVHADPLGASVPRNELKDMLMADAKATDPVFPKTLSSLASAMKDTDGVAGRMRKVGPSFRRIKSKTTQGFIEYWTEEPKRFRPTTRMPQFYNLTNQNDLHGQRYETIELAGMAQYLFDKSVPLDALHPADGYQANADRGKRLFSERGCLACHSHEAFPDSEADFGPELSKVYQKARRDEDNPDFSTWLYTWVKDPERYHERTRMPNLYLEPYKEGDAEVDPAADIAAWLLSGGKPGDWVEAQIDKGDLEVVVSELLAKTISKRAVDLTLKSAKYPLSADKVRGDEVELATADGSAVTDPVEWRQRMLNYVGRKTISKYGCYGCHDVPGFETARPIGAALQDWGRKETSKLAFEHIGEWLHHHGEPDNSSTHKRVEESVHKEASGDFTDEAERSREMSTAYFYQSLHSHGRAGFIWQKLRQPRSYDYEKIEHGMKGYDERLRMPKFPFSDEDIEAVATFVLGLGAEPPAEEYIYKPTREENDRIEGEKLLAKYNCTGCHVLDLPEITVGLSREGLAGDAKTLDEFLVKGQGAAGDVHAAGLDRILKLKPPRDPFTGRKFEAFVDGESEMVDELMFRGMVKVYPDPDADEEEQAYSFDSWETLQVTDDKFLLPQHGMYVPVSQLRSIKPSRGGVFADWLAVAMTKSGSGIGGSGRRAKDGDLNWARQMSPPPLYLEGHKVQTQWLYEFLREPYKLRHAVVLRMPRFNMSATEARTLANYFAAADGVPYPYQYIEPRDADYIARRAKELGHTGLLEDDEDYLETAWSVLNGKGAKAQLCSKCHAVGGAEYVGSGTDPRGPNLQYATSRLRPDWLEMWLYRPSWITPYTSMPVNFSSNGKLMPHLFKGDPGSQVIGVRDALMNYNRLMEKSHTGLAGPTAPNSDATKSQSGGAE